MRPEMAQAIEDLAAATQGEADEGTADSGPVHFSALWSLMHMSCVSMPIARRPRGLPMGTQVIGAYGDDLRTLQAAAFVSRVAASALS